MQHSEIIGRIVVVVVVGVVVVYAINKITSLRRTLIKTKHTGTVHAPRLE